MLQNSYWKDNWDYLIVNGNDRYSKEECKISVLNGIITIIVPRAVRVIEKDLRADVLILMDKWVKKGNLIQASLLDEFKDKLYSADHVLPPLEYNLDLMEVTFYKN